MSPHGSRTIERFAAAVVATAVAIMACEKDEAMCISMDCGNVVTTTIEVPRSAQELDGARLELCRNEQCAVTFLAGNPRNVERETIRCDPRGDPAVKFDCGPSMRIDASSVSFDIWYEVPSPHDLVDGDRFTLRVLDASGSVVWAEKTGTIANYEVVQRGCDGEYFCRRGSF